MNCDFVDQWGQCHDYTSQLSTFGTWFIFALLILLIGIPLTITVRKLRAEKKENEAAADLPRLRHLAETYSNKSLDN